MPSSGRWTYTRPASSTDCLRSSREKPRFWLIAFCLTSHQCANPSLQQCVQEVFQRAILAANSAELTSVLRQTLANAPDSILHVRRQLIRRHHLGVERGLAQCTLEKGLSTLGCGAQHVHEAHLQTWGAHRVALLQKIVEIVRQLVGERTCSGRRKLVPVGALLHRMQKDNALEICRVHVPAYLIQEICEESLPFV